MQDKKTPSIFILLVITFACFIVASILVFVIQTKGVNTATLRLESVVQAVLLFIAPALAYAALGKRNPMAVLRLNVAPPLGLLALSVFILFMGMPMFESIVIWNENITFPDALAPLEQTLRNMENAAQEATKLIMGDHTAPSLIVSLIVVALLAGFSEELWFRGAFQQSILRKHPHWAIWITAFIFSAIHLQFFGFFPRLLLGAFLGYIFYWSGSLWVPIIVHALNNAMVVIMEYTGNNGNVFAPSEHEYPKAALIVASTFAVILLLRLFVKYKKVS